MRCPRWVFQGMKYSGWPKTTKGSTSVCLKELVIIPCVGDISGYRLDSLCFLSFWNRHDRSGTYTHTHTVVSSSFIPRRLLCGLLKVLAPISSLFLFFFFSHSAGIKRNKRFRHCTSHLSVAPFPPFSLACLLLLLLCFIYLFASVAYNLNSLRRSKLLLRQGETFVGPSRFFFSFSFFFCHMDIGKAI